MMIAGGKEKEPLNHIITRLVIMFLFQFPPFKFNFEKSISRCHNATKLGVKNKSTILNRFVLHTLQRNITRLAVITRKTNINLGILKGGKLEKSRHNDL